MEVLEEVRILSGYFVPQIILEVGGPPLLHITLKRLPPSPPRGDPTGQEALVPQQTKLQGSVFDSCPLLQAVMTQWRKLPIYVQIKPEMVYGRIICSLNV